MATRYGYSRTFKAPGAESIETFSVDSASSFDEAQRIVDRGIYDRQLEIKKAQPVPVAPVAPPVASKNSFPS